MSVKEKIQRVIQYLPDDCTFEDAQYRLYVMQKVERGFAAADRGEVVSQEDMRKRLAQWQSE